MKHKNAEVISAWAEGKVVQFKHPSFTGWTDYDLKIHTYGPWEGANYQWRIKPEVKPDFTRLGKFNSEPGSSFKNGFFISAHTCEGKADIEVTFDGETGKFKSVKAVNNA